jgi:hypothetical protein
MSKQTHETSQSSRKDRLVVAGKFVGAAAVTSLVAFAYHNSEGYGYHPDRNPSPPTYLETHAGINPANILPSDSGK